MVFLHKPVSLLFMLLQWPLLQIFFGLNQISSIDLALLFGLGLLLVGTAIVGSSVSGVIVQLISAAGSRLLLGDS